MHASREGLTQLAEALAPATVLRKLAGSESPEVRLHLAGGQVLTGRPVRVDTDRGQEVVVLAGERGGGLTYALLSSIVAVEVREPERVQDVLTGGRLPQPITGEPVTRLALRRDFAPTEEFPVEVDWASLPDSAPAVANMDRLLRGLRDVARDVRADEMGRQAWAAIGALRVGHRDGAALSVRRAPDGLLVQADLAAALPRDLAGELSRQINAVL